MDVYKIRRVDGNAGIINFMLCANPEFYRCSEHTKMVRRV